MGRTLRRWPEHCVSFTGESSRPEMASCGRTAGLAPGPASGRETSPLGPLVTAESHPCGCWAARSQLTTLAPVTPPAQGTGHGEVCRDASPPHLGHRMLAVGCQCGSHPV